MPVQPTHPSASDALDEVGAMLTGGALIVMALFPLTLPLLALLAIVVLPLVAVGVIVALLAAPIALVRHWRRRSSEPARSAGPGNTGVTPQAAVRSP